MHTVAIIEDEQSIAEMYRIKFVAAKYKVETAKNGKLGLELAEKMRPDIILLDLMMPEMTGDQMLAKMRATDWGKYIKVVILTNVSKDEASDNLDKLGIEDFIIKAYYTPQQVVELVEKILKKGKKK
jgi:DNA-binding response OmpR family regulator